MPDWLPTMPECLPTTTEEYDAFHGFMLIKI